MSQQAEVSQKKTISGYSGKAVKPIALYQTGNATMYGNDFREMCNRLKATVFSVEYTLTTDPSYTYHIELDQAYAGLTYIYQHGDELKIDADKIVIMGESAGGHLTTRIAMWNKDKSSAPVPVKGAVLIYPMLDYRTGGPNDLHPDETTGEFIWTKEMNVKGWADLKHGQEIPADEMIYFTPAVATPEQLKGFPPRPSSSSAASTSSCMRIWPSWSS